MSSMGEKLRKHRKEKGYSLDKLAEITGSSKSYIWELENRNNRRPSAQKLTKIADALSVSTHYLLDDSYKPSEDAVKDALFRKFKKLSPGDRRKIEKIIDMWIKEYCRKV